MIYGANGYTGELIARSGVPLQPTLAGRDMNSVSRLAGTLNLPYRVFDLSHIDLTGVDVVLHCAGPFSQTSRPMVDACLSARAHYLDITGEVEVFEACAARDREATNAGVMVMPGVGFDVVPSDCLAAHLKKRLPSANRLALGFQGMDQVSRGTATTMIENVHRGGMVRQNGKLTRVPAGHKTRTIDFGRGPTAAIAIPWGDLSTAYHSTGIPNIEVFMAAPLAIRVGTKLLSALSPLVGSAPAQSFLKSRVRAGQRGPNEEQRALTKSYLWGEASDGSRTVTSRLEAPNGYTLTVLTALEIATRVLAGDFKPGYQTPSSAYGAELILEVEGCTRSD
jgi:short subunit dehydrogenase-like uncharacterized protein